MTPLMLIEFSGQSYPFDLGTSERAQAAIATYNDFCRTGQYEHLQNCFANLHLLSRETPEKAIVACQASNTLGICEFPKQTNIYRGLFIANCVSSIIHNAGFHPTMKKTKELWDQKAKEISKIISLQGLNKEAACDAGLLVLTPQKK